MKRISPMSEEEFEKYLDKEMWTFHLLTYEGVKRFRSIRRAIRRGHVSIEGIVYPRRPFHNKANTCKRKGHHSRVMNERKKMVYEQLKRRKTT